MGEKNYYSRNPLTTIGIFAGLVEGAFAVTVVAVPDDIKIVVVAFMIFFTICTFGVFVYILLKKPYLLYSPGEYGDQPKFREYFETFSQLSHEPSTSITEVTIEAEKFIEMDKQEEVAVKEVQKSDWFTLFMEDRYKEARELLQQEIEKAENEPQRVLLKRQAAGVLSYIDFYSAVTEYEALLREHPNESAIYSMFAYAHERTGQFSAAVKILDRGVSSVKKGDKVSLKLEKLRVLAIDEKFSDIAQAKKLTIDIVKSTEAPLEIAKAYRTLGQLCERLKQSDTAKQAFILAYNAAPADTNNVTEVAGFYNRISDHNTELYFRVNLVRLMPNNESALVLLANCYYGLTLRDLAFKTYSTLAETAKGYGSWVPANIGNLLHSVGLHTLAIKSLEDALKISPTDSYSRERISDAILQAKQQVEKADTIVSAAETAINAMDLSLDEKAKSAT